MWTFCLQWQGRGREVKTHQQARGDGDNVDHGVLGGDLLAGVGNVAKDIAMYDRSEDEVNVANQDER